MNGSEPNDAEIAIAATMMSVSLNEKLSTREVIGEDHHEDAGDFEIPFARATKVVGWYFNEDYGFELCIAIMLVFSPFNDASAS